MNTRALFPLLSIVASFPASVGSRAVKDGWCQAVTGDGRALVMLKNGTIGITDLMQGCLNGIQTLLSNRISINGNLIPTSQMYNQQTRFRTVEMEAGQAPEMVRKAVHSITERDVSVLHALSVRTELTRDNMLKVCPKSVTLFVDFSLKQTTTINKGPVLQAARQTYARGYDEETTETTDFGSYGVKDDKVEFEILSPENHVYDEVTVIIGTDGNATGANVEFIRKWPACRIATLFYCPEALSHANRRLPSQQLAAMCLLRVTRERIFGWSSTIPKGSCADGARILNLMPENS